MSNNNLWEEFQSAFRAKYSDKTVLTTVTNDLLVPADSDYLNILILLDLIAAFDTICHNLQLNQLKTLLGVTDTPLSWLRPTSQLENSLFLLAALVLPLPPFPMVSPRAQFLNHYCIII